MHPFPLQEPHLCRYHHHLLSSHLPGSLGRFCDFTHSLEVDGCPFASGKLFYMLSIRSLHRSLPRWFIYLLYETTLLKGVGDLGFSDFHQRTLSASSSATAKLRCYAAALLIPTFGIPPVLIGAIAASTGEYVQESSKKVDSSNGSIHLQSTFLKTRAFQGPDRSLTALSE